MFDQPRVADWPALAEEFDRWGKIGRLAELWWRDDDATAATPQLDRLLRLAEGVPLGLAVIPAFARPDLAEAVLASPRIAVLQHGWRHVNHAVAGKKSEYPAARPASLVAAELAAGQGRLRAMFGRRSLPVLVPPWNRLADELLPALPAVGIATLSATPPRHNAALPPGLGRLDVHVDLVDWRGTRGFVGAGAALAGLLAQLRDRRKTAGGGPVGILTHHLIMDDPAASFLRRLAALIEEHRAARWVGVEEAVR